MQERIIVASLLNGSELLKSLAKNGVNTINMRIMNSGELARLACMKSAVSMEEQFIDAKEECVLIAKAAEDNTYFNKPSYSDIQTLAKAIKTLRMIATQQQEDTQITNALKKGVFKEKNEALISVYQNYMAL
ncbi:MAG: hypothetical protein HUJ58_08220, partial [Erysipelotrichaceae bacterium]|nr:hypothetical protein [Erysipelotrichaceae bacterium]